MRPVSARALAKIQLIGMNHEKNIIFSACYGYAFAGICAVSRKKPRCEQLREKSVRFMDQIIKETAGMGSSGQPGHGPKVVALEKELEALKRKIDAECKPS